MSDDLAELKARYERLHLLYQVENVIHSTLEPQPALQLIAREAVRLMHASSGSVILVNPTTGFLEIHAAQGLPPNAADLKLRDDLRTRLGWGHVFALQALDDTQRREVLRDNAQARGIALSDEVMDFMLTRFSRDLGSLMQLLDQLDGYALANKRAITIPLVKSMLEDV